MSLSKASMLRKKTKQKQALSVNGLQPTLSPGSVGPMDPKRIVELGDLTKKVKAGKIFVTAFLDFATYKKFAADLAWDTEVWIAEMPEHMIHLNGDRFLGPRG